MDKPPAFMPGASNPRPAVDRRLSYVFFRMTLGSLWLVTTTALRDCQHFRQAHGCYVVSARLRDPGIPIWTFLHERSLARLPR
jgi:hypothetical protein